MTPSATNVTETAHITIRLPKSHLDRLEELRVEADRSLSAEVRQAIKAHVERATEKEAA